MKHDVVELHVQLQDGSIRIFKGRVAWTLDRLIRAGETGCTPIEQPAPRWSDYVFRLRNDGIDIETIDEKHGGAYRGVHARYVLRTPLEVTKVVHVGEECDAA